MAIYQLSQDQIAPVTESSFATLGISERADIQRLLRDQIEVIAPDTLVIDEEFGHWDDSRRRIDLLAIDKQANLVVIELKRTDDGGHMELQAIRYAAMVSTITFEQAVESFGRYLNRREDSRDPRQTMLDFLEWESPDEDEFAKDVSIVLVSADFSKELTTTVLWLLDRQLDIRCIRIKPYGNKEQVLLDVQQVIPLPEAEEYQVRVREKKSRERETRQTNRDLTKFTVTVDGQAHSGLPKRRAILLVVKSIAAKGSHPDEIKTTLNRKRPMFFEVEGEVNGEEMAIALEEAGFESKRWFIRDEELIKFGNSTFSMWCEWGKHTHRFMDQLVERFAPNDIEVRTDE